MEKGKVIEPEKDTSGETLNEKIEQVGTFCGHQILVSNVMSDGRRMCRSYKLQQIKQEEIKDLYVQTVEFLYNTYHIKLRKNSHLCLQTSDFIERQLMVRNDEYGDGYRMLKEYLETEEQKGKHYTPYEAFNNLINNLY